VISTKYSKNAGMVYKLCLFLCEMIFEGDPIFPGFFTINREIRVSSFLSDGADRSRNRFRFGVSKGIKNPIRIRHPSSVVRCQSRCRSRRRSRRGPHREPDAVAGFHGCPRTRFASVIRHPSSGVRVGVGDGVGVGGGRIENLTRFAFSLLKSWGRVFRSWGRLLNA